MTKLQHQFLEALREIGIVQYACDQVPINRSSVYKSRNDLEFKKLMDEALIEGEARLNDVTELQMLDMAKKGHWQALKFVLTYRNPKFRKNLNSSVDSGLDDHLTSEEEAFVDRALNSTTNISN